MAICGRVILMLHLKIITLHHAFIFTLHTRKLVLVLVNASGQLEVKLIQWIQGIKRPVGREPNKRALLSSCDSAGHLSVKVYSSFLICTAHKHAGH